MSVVRLAVVATDNSHERCPVLRSRTTSSESSSRCTVKRRSTRWRVGSDRHRSTSLDATSPGYVSTILPACLCLQTLTVRLPPDPVRVASFCGGCLVDDASHTIKLGTLSPVSFSTNAMTSTKNKIQWVSMYRWYRKTVLENSPASNYNRDGETGTTVSAFVKVCCIMVL